MATVQVQTTRQAMYVQSGIVARSRNHCYCGKGTIRFLSIVDLHVAVNDYIITEGGALESQQCLPSIVALQMAPTAIRYTLESSSEIFVRL
jgi:hypothetical protein